MYKATELRNKSREELLVLISELKGKLLALRFESATGQLRESHLPKSTKKDIALIFTILKEKEQGIVYTPKSNKVKTIVETKPAVKPAAEKVVVAEKPKVETKPVVEKSTPVEAKVESTPVVEKAKEETL